MRVPDYYEKFECKCGDCRRCCCSGWGITASYLEYCRFLGMECSQELRKKLDCAFFVLPDADNERYAELKPNYLGECPLRDASGLCSLQCECGEEALPSVCRMYPRNTLFSALDEGACACSCERVVELLFEKTEGLSFAEVDRPEGGSKPSGAEEEEEKTLQEVAIAALQDRTSPFKERLKGLGKVFGIDGGEECEERFLFDSVRTLSDLLASYNGSFADLTERIRDKFRAKRGEDIKKIFDMAKDEFEEKYPLHGIYFENLLVNHVIFERFPHSFKGETPRDKYVELCLVYVLTRFVSILYTSGEDGEEPLVDCVAALFRCFEHSNAETLLERFVESTGKPIGDVLFSLIKRF